MAVVLKALSALAIVLALYLAVLYFSWPGYTTKEFSDYEQAVTGDPYEDQWLPSFLPRSASGIVLRYGIDPSFLRAEFFYKAEDETKMLQRFERLNDPDQVAQVIAELSRSSWREPIPAGAQVFVPRGMAERHRELEKYLVLDRPRNRAWYSLDL